MFEIDHVEHKRHFLLESDHALVKDLHLAVEIGQVIAKDKFSYTIELEKEDCLIKGKKSKVLEKDFYVLDSIAYKKVNYFFSSIYSSLTKYKTFDIYMNSSSVYRFYSDVMHIDLDKDNTKSLLVKRTIEYIENSFKENISLDDICYHLGYCKYYVLHVFQDVMGLSVHDFIVRRRLTESKNFVVGRCAYD